LILHQLSEADIKPAAKLWYEGWQLGHADYAPAALTKLRTLENYEDRILSNKAACFVSGHNGSPTGFIRIIDDELDQFYVDPNSVGQGLGRKLMQAAEAKLIDLKITKPHLFCAEQNHRAAGFYEAMGWTHKGVSLEPFETSASPFVLPVIRFEKDLST